MSTHLLNRSIDVRALEIIRGKNKAPALPLNPNNPDTEFDRQKVELFECVFVVLCKKVFNHFLKK